jgi:hypothetical protein
MVPIHINLLAQVMVQWQASFTMAEKIDSIESGVFIDHPPLKVSASLTLLQERYQVLVSILNPNSASRLFVISCNRHRSVFSRLEMHQN